MRQRVWAALRTWYGKVAVVLVVLMVLVWAGYPLIRQTIATHGATSLRIIVWQEAVYGPPPGQPPIPTKKVFDKTITDLGFVHDVQNQLDGSQVGIALGVGCATAPTSYLYEFRFATLGMTTQVYSGNSLCTGWNITTLGVPTVAQSHGEQAGVTFVKVDGVEIMRALHQRTGMPISGFLPPM